MADQVELPINESAVMAEENAVAANEEVGMPPPMNTAGQESSTNNEEQEISGNVAAGGDKPKPKASQNASLYPDDDEYIKLRVVGQDANEMQFRVKMKTSMAKVKKTYADRMGLDLKSLRFLFDGNRVNDSDTPKTLDMLDDDVMEVYQEQTGGYQ